MQMRTRRTSRHADQPDFIAFFQLLPFFDQDFAHVDITGCQVVPVRQQYGFSGQQHIFVRQQYRSVGGGANRRSRFCRNIQSVMRAARDAVKNALTAVNA